MIRHVTGNLLQARVDALVNTVNTVGVMGKGIALQFKRAYPAMFNEYQAAALAGKVVVGQHARVGLRSGDRAALRHQFFHQTALA